MFGNTEILVISDTHLGSACASSKDLLFLLKNITYSKLIILGDLFDHGVIKKLRKIDWEFLSYLENRAAAGDDIVWFKGNHDRDFPHTLEHLSKIPKIEELILKHKNRKYLFIHGDKFDKNIKSDGALSQIAGFFDTMISVLNLKRRIVMGTIGKAYSLLIQLSNQVGDEALKYAKQKNVDYIICGHTHHAIQKELEVGEDKKIIYLNSGSWTQSPSTYITIDNRGPKIREFSRKKIKKFTHNSNTTENRNTIK